MSIQYDGTVVPSHLSVYSRGYSEDMGLLSDMALRLGEVKKIVYPSDEESKTRKYIEYTVDVFSRENGSSGAVVRYEGCLISNLFGSGSDLFKYTLRADTSEERQNIEDFGVGAKVLLMCHNGESVNSYILGGIRDINTETSLDRAEDKHHLLFNFNGIGVNINNDGELALTFGGATKVNGEPAQGVDTNSSGAGITLKKNGTLEIQDAQTSQKIHLLHPDGKIHIEAAGILETFAPNGTTIDSSGGTVKITSLGTKIGGDAAVDALVMGTTYRTQEVILHTQLLTALGVMSGLLGTLSGLNATIGGIMMGISAAHAAPIVGPIIASPMVATAGASFIGISGAIAGLASQVGIMITAITTFESNSLTYLSRKNTTD